MLQYGERVTHIENVIKTRGMPAYRLRCRGRAFRVELEELLCFFYLLDRRQEIRLNVIDGLSQGRFEFLKVLLVKEDLVLFILILTNAFALGDRDIKILLGFGCLYVKKVRAFSSAYSFCKEFIFVPVVFQGLRLLRSGCDVVN